MTRELAKHGSRAAQGESPPRPAVFLDRDGTLIEDRGHIRLCSEVHFLPETAEALRRLREHFLFFIVTNQPGVAEGLLTLDDVDRVNAHVVRELAEEGVAISEVYSCPHRRTDDCTCIKPKPHFLHRASERYHLDLSRSFVIGDHPHDMELARAVGAHGVYVLTGHGAKHVGELPDDAVIASSILEAVDIVLANARQRPAFGERALRSSSQEEEMGGCILRPNPSGDRPEVHPSAYVDPAAQVIGKVRIGPGVFVGPNAVIRADEPGPDGTVSPIEIGADSNVQDGVIVHALAGTAVAVGPRSSLSHGAVIHGPCAIAGDCFVGFRAVLFDVRLSEGVFVGHAASVSRVKLSPHSSVPSGASIETPEQTRALSETDAGQREFMARVVQTNVALAKNYLGPNLVDDR
ncbi:MAG: HAD-IIIA family hydrolase [Planctomycetota bacterium]